MAEPRKEKGFAVRGLRHQVRDGVHEFSFAGSPAARKQAAKDLRKGLFSTRPNRMTGGSDVELGDILWRAIRAADPKASPHPITTHAPPEVVADMVGQLSEAANTLGFIPPDMWNEIAVTLEGFPAEGESQFQETTTPGVFQGVTGQTFDTRDIGERLARASQARESTPNGPRRGK